MSDEKIVATAGKTTKLEFNAADANNGKSTDDTSGGEGAGQETEEAKAIRLAEEKEYEGLSPEEITTKKAEKATAAAEAAKNKLPELTAEQRTALLKETLGEDFDGNLDNLKAKLKPASIDQTPEEKEAAEKAFELRMQDVYLKAGGSIENFAALKTVAAMDLTQLSVAEIKKELKASGIEFTEAEVDSIMKERYYQLNPDELEKEDGETDADFEARKAAITKKVTYGAKQLEAKGKAVQDRAKSTLNNLRTVVTTFDADEQEKEKTEKKISSKADEYLKTVPKKLKIELGKGLDETDLEPFSSDVQESDIEEVRSILKDPAKRKQLLQTQDGAFNVEAIADILLENRNLKKAIKVGFLEGGSRQVEFFRKKFPFLNSGDVGVGAAIRQPDKNGAKRTPASAGATTKA